MGQQAIINGFMAGELSPAMDMRSDLKGTKYGVKQATNWISTFQGPIGTREGTHHQALLDIATLDADNARVVSMDSKSTQYMFWVLGTYDFFSTIPRVQVYAVGSSITLVDVLTGTDLGSRLNAMDLAEYTILKPPGLEELWFFCDNYDPWKIYEVSSGVWGVADLSFTSAPAAWSSEPQCACFYQNRMYVAGSGDYAHVFWASVVGDYLDFTLGTLPDEAFTYELAESVAINWMSGMKNLIIGSDKYEYIVTAQDDVVMPGDIQVQRQSNYGSCVGQAEPIGNGMLYRSIDRTKLRLIRYNWQEDQWVSKNLLFASEHFTEDAEIKEISFHPVKEHIYCTLTNGRVLVGIYNGVDQTIGWTPLEYFEDVESARVIRRSSTAWMVSMATFDSVAETHNLVYHFDKYPAQSDNNYYHEYDSYPGGIKAIYAFIGEVITATALTGLTNLVATYVNVPVKTELWDSNSANLTAPGIYGWTENDADTNVSNVDGTLDVVIDAVTLDTYAYLPIIVLADTDIKYDTASWVGVGWADTGSYTWACDGTQTAISWVYNSASLIVGHQYEMVIEVTVTAGQFVAMGMTWSTVAGTHTGRAVSTAGYFYFGGDENFIGTVTIVSLKEVSDFSEAPIKNEYYLFECEYRGTVGSYGILRFGTSAAAPAGTARPFDLSLIPHATNWTSITQQCLIETDNALGLYILMGTIGDNLQFRNFSLKKITIIANETVIENLTLDGSNQYTTTVESQYVYLGIPYTCTLETLPPHKQLPEPTHGKKKRWSKAYIRVIDSYPVTIEAHVPASYTKATQEQQITARGWDRDATITIIQDKPYKSVIAGIYGELAEYVL